MSEKRLTKKEKKLQAHKQRKGKGREEPLDVPILDNGADAEDQRIATSAKVSSSAAEPSKRAKKRTRDEMESGAVTLAAKLPKASSSKKVKPKPPSEDEEDSGSESEETKDLKKKASSPKYILFVGAFRLRGPGGDLPSYAVSSCPSTYQVI